MENQKKTTMQIIKSDTMRMLKTSLDQDITSVVLYLYHTGCFLSLSLSLQVVGAREWKTKQRPSVNSKI